MANAIATQVQELYVGYLGRAAEQAGLNYWVNQISSGAATIESVAQGFTESNEYAAAYGDLDTAALVAQVYENVLGREGEAAGLAYWENMITSGTITADQLVNTMLNNLGSIDQATIDNRVYVANQYTAAAGSAYDAQAGAAIIAGVNQNPATVTAALATLPTNADSLASDLAAYQAALEAKADFLAALDLDDDATTDTTEAAVTDLVDSSVLTSPVAEFNTTFGTTLTATSTAAQQAAAFAAARNVSSTQIADQQADVAAAQAAVDKLNDGKDVAAYIAAVEAAAATNDALEPAAANVAGAVAAYNNYSANTDVAASSYTFAAGDASITDGTELANVAQLNDDGVVVAKAGVTDTTNPGITALLSAINADISAKVADYNADEAVTKAAALVGNGSTDSALVDTLVQEKQALADMQDDTAIEEAIAEVQEAYSLNAQLVALNKAIDTALDQVESIVDAVDVVDASTTVTADAADLFIFDGETAGAISSFEAEDRLFIGTGFSLVNVAEDDVVGIDSIGSASSLEVIWDAENSTLYIEQEAFGGNASGTEDLVAIQLTGYTGDVTLSSEGFIQLA